MSAYGEDAVSASTCLGVSGTDGSPRSGSIAWLALSSALSSSVMRYSPTDLRMNDASMFR